jgi:pantoate--beta-alanine ligase
VPSAQDKSVQRTQDKARRTRLNVVHSIVEVRDAIRRWHEEGHTVGFVPTMGNLHEGHLSLVAHARERADRVVASIFVNPTQFGENEDFDTYPRTLEEDGGKLEAAGCELLFAPAAEEVYPYGPAHTTHITVPALAHTLCGAIRPGHFDGVATVVVRLFNMVPADVAVFGEKDYQQLQIIRFLVKDLAVPIEIAGAPTVREADGLAMSSRNAYLNAEERQAAPGLYQALQDVARRVAGGESVDRAEKAALATLAGAGFRPDYVAVRGTEDLAPAKAHNRPWRVFGAAWLGQARLIDNVPVPD